jgi:hypothetical protein
MQGSLTGEVRYKDRYQEAESATHLLEILPVQSRFSSFSSRRQKDKAGAPSANAPSVGGGASVRKTGTPLGASDASSVPEVFPATIGAFAVVS